eukprot:5509958-Pleurochrysis_carterae.AAC.4
MPPTSPLPTEYVSRGIELIADGVSSTGGEAGISSIVDGGRAEVVCPGNVASGAAETPCGAAVPLDEQSDAATPDGAAPAARTPLAATSCLAPAREPTGLHACGAATAAHVCVSGGRRCASSFTLARGDVRDIGGDARGGASVGAARARSTISLAHACCNSTSVLDSASVTKGSAGSSCTNALRREETVASCATAHSEWRCTHASSAVVSETRA